MGFKNEKIETENTFCKICSSKDNHFFLNTKDYQHGIGGEFTLVKCESCGLVYTNPRPKEKSLHLLYPEEYVPYQQFKYTKPSGKKFEIQKHLLANYYNYPFKKSLFWKLALMPFFVLQKIKRSKVIPFTGKGRMLEIGCGAGENLAFMNDLGWKTKGIEFSSDAAKSGRQAGVDIRVGTAESVEIKEKFDVVLMIYILEHLVEPRKVLKKINKWLERDGKLIIDIPNINAFEFTLFKDKWFALEMPRHFYHFSPQTVTKLLESEGFKVEHILYDTTSKRFLQSLNYLLGTKGLEHSKIFHLLVMPIAYLAALFGKSPTMRVTARVR